MTSTLSPTINCISNETEYKKNGFIANLTKKQFIICKFAAAKKMNKQILELLKPLSEDDALLPQDICQSLWNRTDKIVFVPQHLENYVKKEYIQIFIY
jgi:hypothetical protein